MSTPRRKRRLGGEYVTLGVFAYLGGPFQKLGDSFSPDTPLEFRGVRADAIVVAQTAVVTSLAPSVPLGPSPAPPPPQPPSSGGGGSEGGDGAGDSGGGSSGPGGDAGGGDAGDGAGGGGSDGGVGGAGE